MKVLTENYLSQLKLLPSLGRHIIAHQQAEQLVVYQAYKPSIAAYAVQHQRFGGSEYSYNRMSWIKPNFLWMMFRCGWAQKENQERVLAIWLDKADFDKLLQQAVLSSFNRANYESEEVWQNELATKEVRLQWDPDHDPHGNKIERRALQLGLKGDALEKFGKEDVRFIEDITDFVTQQRQFVIPDKLDKLLVPCEKIYTPDDITLCKKIGIHVK